MPEHRDYQRIRTAIRYLISHAHQQPELSDLAQALHLSEFHLQRLFTRWAGVSPKRFLQHVTCEAAKLKLANNPSLLELAHDLGLSGSSRLHDLFVTLEAMTPGEYKQGGAGLQIHWQLAPTQFGRVMVARTLRGICAIQFMENAGSAEAWLTTRWPNAQLHYTEYEANGLIDRLFQPLQKNQPSTLALNVQGTNFQIQVWRALLQIPYGSLASYGQIAHAIGHSGAARAVGTAIGANPIACLIPCHRVIRAEGVIGAYRWGSERKADLLAWESASVLAS